MITLGRLSRIRHPRSGWITTMLLTAACLLFALAATHGRTETVRLDARPTLAAPPLERLGEPARAFAEELP